MLLPIPKRAESRLKQAGGAENPGLSPLTSVLLELAIQAKPNWEHWRVG